jgi:hypothetical protein
MKEAGFIENLNASIVTQRPCASCPVQYHNEPLSVVRNPKPML